MGIPRVKVAPSCSSLEQGYEHPRNARPMHAACCKQLPYMVVSVASSRPS
jgi:hypothetical protein